MIPLKTTYMYENIRVIKNYNTFVNKYIQY